MRWIIIDFFFFRYKFFVVVWLMNVQKCWFGENSTSTHCNQLASMKWTVITSSICEYCVCMVTIEDEIYNFFGGYNQSPLTFFTLSFCAGHRAKEQTHYYIFVFYTTWIQRGNVVFFLFFFVFFCFLILNSGNMAGVFEPVWIKNLVIKFAKKKIE